jgi:prepilin-type N-terminal cleavage/methylation domain-containing protein
MRKAFTLIELLVVIAIIAILAAILFPVFAQAKESAKDTQSLSNAKQVGLSHLMYSADADDLFAPTALSHLNRWDTWQGLVQPYMKSWPLMYHPKLPAPSGVRAYWQRLQHWGVMPRAAAVNGPDQIFNWTHGTFTGGQNVRFDGIFGAAIDVAGGSTWYAMRPAPSLSQSNIENISNVIMVVEAGNFDLWWGIFDQGYELGWCSNWGAEWTQPGKQDIFGPHARKRSKVPQTGCRWPDGHSTYVATDGSAKSADYRGRVLGRQAVTGGTFVHPLMWPGAIN